MTPDQRQKILDLTTAAVDAAKLSDDAAARLLVRGAVFGRFTTELVETCSQPETVLRSEAPPVAKTPDASMPPIPIAVRRPDPEPVWPNENSFFEKDGNSRSTLGWLILIVLLGVLAAVVLIKLKMPQHPQAGEQSSTNPAKVTILATGNPLAVASAQSAAATTSRTPAPLAAQPEFALLEAKVEDGETIRLDMVVTYPSADCPRGMIRLHFNWPAFVAMSQVERSKALTELVPLVKSTLVQTYRRESVQQQAQFAVAFRAELVTQLFGMSIKKGSIAWQFPEFTTAAIAVSNDSYPPGRPVKETEADSEDDK